MPPNILNSIKKIDACEPQPKIITQKHTLREMAYHYSNPLSPTSSLRSAALTDDDHSSPLLHNLRIYETARTETAVRGTEHETERGGRWSALRPLPASLRECVRTGLRAVRSATGPRTIPNDRPEAAFSALDGASGGARLFLAQMPPNAPPPTIVWAGPQGQGVAWGQWPCHTFTHCITVLTERNARASYEIDEDEDADAPLPPVSAGTLDGVAHLWLIVPPPPPRGTARLLSALSDAQMRAAVEFVDAAVAEEETLLLLACAEGNEVDVAALAVLLLARRSTSAGSRRPAVAERAPTFPDCRARQRGERALAGCAQTYRAARILDDDPGVSLVWKGLLGWQDVERVQAVLWT